MESDENGEFVQSQHDDDSTIVDLYETEPSVIWKKHDRDDEDESGNRIDRALLEKVRRKLGVVSLSWPESPDLGDDEYFLRKLPPGHSTLSNIEKCLMWYAENFRKQFHTIYSNRKPLLLVCPNECGVPKFVSTSIRRTVLSYAELSSWQGCAKFVRDFLTYEPLAQPLLMPKHLYSMTYLLRKRSANCFELSTFLVSLLLGLGYNAFVVSGYASREITSCNQKMMPCPDLPKEEAPPPPEVKVEIPKYRPTSPPTFQSKYLDDLERLKREKDEEEKREREEERQRLITELERPPYDKLFGQRVHSWVLVLPNPIGVSSSVNTLDITQPTFIEPSTGITYSPVDPLTANDYFGIESIWNEQNYWVNMQSCTEACSKLDWDLGNVELWEHLLPGEPEYMRVFEEYYEQEPDENAGIRRNFHLVMPASYIDSFTIPYEDYEERYPGGKKTIWYKKVKVELFAPYSRVDGMVRSIIKYDDYGCNEPIFAYETYAHRGDKLYKSEKDIVKEIATDFYGKDRPDACKSHSYYSGAKDLADEDRTLQFHKDKRLDDLAKVRMHPLFMLLEFRDTHPDRLHTRYVEYSPYNHGNVLEDVHYRAILKITEKFHRNEKIPPHKDIAIREFDFENDEIRLTYHFSEGEYSQAKRIFEKPPVTERGERLNYLPEMTVFYNPYPMASPENFEDLIDLLELQFTEEDHSVAEIKNYESVILSFLVTRSQEFLKPTMEISRFDPIRNEEARAGLIALEEKIKALSQKEVIGGIDHLAPYIARLGNITYLTNDQALQVRDECINHFKQLSVNRANAILKQFEKASNNLDKLQAILSRAENLSKEEKDHNLEQATKMTLKLSALQVQLNRIRTNIPGKYNALLEFLAKSPQLAILYESETYKDQDAE